MSKKAIILTFLSALAVVCLAAVLSYLVWTNQPSADSSPPVPPLPVGAPAEQPPVPGLPRIAGDILDDGIVSALDINSVIVHWKTIAREYNLVDADSEEAGLISGLDLSQSIKYWQCLEQKGESACPYLSAITSSNDNPPTPSSPDSTTSRTSADAPPTPADPSN